MAKWKFALLVFMGAGAQVHELAAQTASKAFATAVRPVGGDVSWRWSFDELADTCLSGFIEQCMPRNRGYSSPLGGSSEFNSWRAISDVVMRAMPEGSAADRSIFSRESMRLAMRAALQRSDQGLRVR